MFTLPVTSWLVNQNPELQVQTLTQHMGILSTLPILGASEPLPLTILQVFFRLGTPRRNPKQEHNPQLVQDPVPGRRLPTILRESFLQVTLSPNLAGHPLEWLEDHRLILGLGQHCHQVAVGRSLPLIASLDPSTLHFLTSRLNRSTYTR